MKRYKLTKAGISPNEGIERFNGDKKMYEEVLMTFVDDIHYEKLCAAVEKKDIDEAFAEAHALKGVCGNLSLKRMYEDILPVVETLRAGSFDGVEDGMEAVAKDYQDVITALTTD